MIKHYLFVVTIITFVACSSTDNPKKEGEKPAAAVQQKENHSGNILTDTTKVKAWLTRVIENYTNRSDLKAGFDSLRKSLTDSYYNYKQDAINLDYDNGDTTLTPASFEKKWKSKYNIKFVGSGGFIISSQDNGKVKVTSINLIKHMSDSAALYKVEIKDLDFKATFNRDIKVITHGGKLLIDDVVEYN